MMSGWPRGFNRPQNVSGFAGAPLLAYPEATQTNYVQPAAPTVDPATVGYYDQSTAAYQYSNYYTMGQPGMNVQYSYPAGAQPGMYGVQPTMGYQMTAGSSVPGQQEKPPPLPVDPPPAGPAASSSGPFPGVSAPIVLPPAPNYSAIPAEEREEAIVEFWKQRYIHVRPGEQPPFPNKYALRLIVGLEKRAVEGLEVLLKDAKDKELMFEQDQPRGVVPSTMKYVSRCKWSHKQNWVVGYGSTSHEASNAAAVAGLKLLFDPEEFIQILEMNRPERYIGIDIQNLAKKLNQHIISVGGSIPKSHPAAPEPEPKSTTTSFPFEYLKDGESYSADPDQVPNEDSDNSIGGSGPDLTGDEDDDEDLPAERRKFIRLRRDLLTRENRIIKFWLSKRPDPNTKRFPDVFKLRNHRNIGKRAKNAVGTLFQSFPKHQRPVFLNSPSTRPDLGYFHVRCSWENFKQNMYGYGNTPEAAENDAGVKALIKVLGEKDYETLREMTEDTLYEGLDITRIHAHIAYKVKRNPSSHLNYPFTPGFTFETDLVNYPQTLKRFTPPGNADFSVPKPQFELLSKKLRYYGKPEAHYQYNQQNTPEKIAPFQVFDKLASIDNLTNNAVSGLGCLFSGLSEPAPSYTAIPYAQLGTIKVECLARGKYFVEEAPTEEVAKNRAALSALKFLLGEDKYQKLVNKKPVVKS